MVLVVPVIGELVSADGVVDLPVTIRGRICTFDCCRTGSSLALGVPENIVGASDDRLTGRVPPIPNLTVAIVGVVPVERDRDRQKGRCGPRINLVFTPATWCRRSG